ncbi:MAG: hypothetical protein Pars2KO_32260 [Parasphingorhabdus sp.]
MSNTQNTNNRPTHFVRVKTGSGEKARFQTIGFGWSREDQNSFYVKLTGKQVIDSGFYLFPNNFSDEGQENGAAQ